MKTKLTLFVTVLAAALFVGGCASTEPSEKQYARSSLVVKDGKWHHKEGGGLVTGRVLSYDKGALAEDFYLKNGLRHGPYLDWHDGGPIPRRLAVESVYENGKLVRHKEFWFEAKDPFWNGTRWQLIVGGWNQDGTPTKPKK